MFWCLECGKTYRKCKCRVYVSADTLKREKRPVTARERASGGKVKVKGKAAFAKVVEK